MKIPPSYEDDFSYSIVLDTYATKLMGLNKQQQQQQVSFIEGAFSYENVSFDVAKKAEENERDSYPIQNSMESMNKCIVQL